MHELSVTQNILEIALDHAKKANAKQITELHIVIGQLSSVIDDSVQFYWDIICDGTIAQGSTLHFRRLPAIFLCLTCQNEYSPSDDEFTCPACEGENFKILKGEEFYLESIDVEKQPSRGKT